ncbi:MAG TPA: tetratricopeptide repeat protein [Chitinophagaceae bacterium]|nr:tetratricopeptide repeat protein [Chitinophagaceae bacterium]
MNLNYFLLSLLFGFLFSFCASGQSALQYDTIANNKLKNKDLKGALDAYNKGIKADPTYRALYMGRGEVKADLGDYKGSIADFSQCIKIYPDEIAYYQRGICYYMLDDYKHALADFDSTVYYAPDLSYELYFFRGNIKFKLQDLPGSIEEYTKSIAMKPDYAKAYYNRGVSKYFGDQKQEACKDISKAIALGFKDIDPKIKKYCDYYSAH